MRIGINTRLFVKGKMDGIAWYAYEVVRRMVKSHPEHEFVFFFDRPFREEYIFGENVRPVVLHPQARHPLLWKWFFEISLRHALKKEKTDVFFSPDGFICLHTDVRTVDIIHDINFEHFPEFLHTSHRKYYHRYFPLFAKKCDALVTVSEFCKKDIANTYRIPEEKIRVAYNAAADDFFPISEEAQTETREKWSRGKHYFVFIGTTNRRKNIQNQLKAYDVYRETGGSNLLLFAGSRKYWDSEMEDCLLRRKYRNDILFTDYVSTTELNRILSSADGLLYVSYFEGFGVPILEAYATHTPVITSLTTAMPEVAGDAAILVHPENPDEIAQAMQKIDRDKLLVQKMQRKGIQQLRKFSWDRSAETLWEIINDTATLNKK